MPQFKGMNEIICSDCFRVFDERAVDRDDWMVVMAGTTPLTIYCSRHVPRGFHYCPQHGYPEPECPEHAYDGCLTCVIDSYLDATKADQRELVIKDIESYLTKRYRDWGVLDAFAGRMTNECAQMRAVLPNAEWVPQYLRDR